MKHDLRVRAKSALFATVQHTLKWQARHFLQVWTAFKSVLINSYHAYRRKS